MNKVYKLVWSYVSRCLVPVAEGARGRGKGGSAAATVGAAAPAALFGLTPVMRAFGQAMGLGKPMLLGSAMAMGALAAGSALAANVTVTEDTITRQLTNYTQEVSVSGAQVTISVPGASGISADGQDDAWAVWVASGNVAHATTNAIATASLTINNAGAISFQGGTDNNYGAAFYPSTNNINTLLGEKAIEISSLGGAAVSASVVDTSSEESYIANATVSIQNTAGSTIDSGQGSAISIMGQGRKVYRVDGEDGFTGVTGYYGVNTSATGIAASNNAGSAQARLTINNAGTIRSTDGEAVFVGGVIDLSGAVGIDQSVSGMYSTQNIVVGITNSGTIAGSDGGVIFDTRQLSVGGAGNNNVSSNSLNAGRNVTFSLDNSGSITSSAGRGVALNDVYAGGNASIDMDNSGLITANSTAIEVRDVAADGYVAVRVDNSGGILSTAGRAVRVSGMTSMDGLVAVTVNNDASGTISTGSGDAVYVSELLAENTYAGNQNITVNVNNAGNVESLSTGQAIYIVDVDAGANESSGINGGAVTVSVVNTGLVASNSSSASIEVIDIRSADNNSITLFNTGSISNSGEGGAVAIEAVEATDQGSASVQITNSGSIAVSPDFIGSGGAVRVSDVNAYQGNATVSLANTSLIDGGLVVDSVQAGSALDGGLGNYVETAGSRLKAKVEITNTGTINGRDGSSAIRVNEVAAFGDAQVIIQSSGADSELSAQHASAVSVSGVQSVMGHFSNIADPAFPDTALMVTAGANAFVSVNNASTVTVTAAAADSDLVSGGINVHSVLAVSDYQYAPNSTVISGGTLATVNIQNTGSITIDSITTDSLAFDSGRLAAISVAPSFNSNFVTSVPFLGNGQVGVLAATLYGEDGSLTLGDTVASVTINNAANAVLAITAVVSEGETAEVSGIAVSGVVALAAVTDSLVDFVPRSQAPNEAVRATVDITNGANISLNVTASQGADVSATGISVQNVFVFGEDVTASRAAVNVVNTGNILIAGLGDQLNAKGISISGVDVMAFSGSATAEVNITNSGDISITQGVTPNAMPNGDAISVTNVNASASDAIASVNITNSGNLSANRGIVVSDVSGYVQVNLNAPINGTRVINTISDAVTIQNVTGDNLDANGNAVVVNVARGVAITSTEGSGIVVSDVRNGNVSVTVNNNVTAKMAAIDISDVRDGSVTITVDSGVTLLSTMGDDEGRSRASAVQVSDVAGDVRFINHGTVVGRVALAPNGNTGASYQNTGTWQVGDSNAAAYTGRNSTVTNTGTIQVTGDARFEDMTNFVNTGGLIDATQETVAGTFSQVTFDFVGSTFTGGQNSTFKIDADLGLAEADESGPWAGVTTGSDRIIFTGEDGVGATMVGKSVVVIKDKSPTQAGVNSPIGEVAISVEHASNNAPALDTFALSKPVNKGLWQYDLYGDAGASETVWRLASTPSHHAFELPVMLTSTQHVWHESTSSIQDRMYELRAKQGADGSAVSGGWAKVIASTMQRDLNNSTTLYGKTNAVDNRYTQNLGGLHIGFDHVIDRTEDSRWQLGVSAGLMQSNTRFKATGTKMDSDVQALGVYASYISGGAFVNFTLNSTKGDIDYSMSNARLNADGGVHYEGKFDSKASGSALEAGYRFTQPTWYLEPSVRIASTKATVSNGSFLMTDVEFPSARSVQNSVSLSTGYQTTLNSMRAEPYFRLSLIDVSAGDNKVRLTSGGQSAVELADNKVKGMVQLAAGVRLFEGKSNYGYVGVNFKTNSEVNQTSVSAGFKYNW